MNIKWTLIDSSYEQQKRIEEKRKKIIYRRIHRMSTSLFRSKFNFLITVILYQFDFMTTVQILVSFIYSFMNRY